MRPAQVFSDTHAMEVMPDERAVIRPVSPMSARFAARARGCDAHAAARNRPEMRTGHMGPTPGAPHPPRALPAAGRVSASCCALPRQSRRRGTATRDDAGAHQKLTAGGHLFRMCVARWAHAVRQSRSGWGSTGGCPTRRDRRQAPRYGHDGRAHTTEPPGCGGPAHAAATAGESR